MTQANPRYVTGPMPPYRLYRDFLEPELVARLLDYVISNEAAFVPSTVKIRQLRPDLRTSLCLREFGPLKEVIGNKIAALTAELITALRVTPFQPVDPELEVIAHGDGAFYVRHMDTATGSERKSVERMVSAVYYFSIQPPRFSGGALRLHAFGPDDSGGEAFADILPENNRLLVFPSWAPHEVRPVACPSGRFADSRFAINCWLRRKRPDASGANR